MSTLTVSPFFVENISELQLNALKLVTNVSIRLCCTIVNRSSQEIFWKKKKKKICFGKYIVPWAIGWLWIFIGWVIVGVHCISYCIADFRSLREASAAHHGRHLIIISSVALQQEESQKLQVEYFWIFAGRVVWLKKPVAMLRLKGAWYQDISLLKVMEIQQFCFNKPLIFNWPLVPQGIMAVVML